LDLEDAERLIARCTRTTALLARRALRAVLADLKKRGHDVSGCGVLTGSGRAPASVAAILASHPAMHTADGELFRNALIQASEHYRLPVLRVVERELHARAAAELGLRVEELQRRVSEMGRAIGPPWSQDQKYAAALAWLALAAAAQRPLR